MIETIATIAGLLIAGIPKLVKAVRAAKNPADIKLGDFLSTDAVAKVQSVATKAKAFEDRFPD